MIEQNKSETMREQFEKLPEIAERLKNYKIAFYNGEYIAEGRVDDCKLWIAVGFVGGAWYAYQEQQKNIDAILYYINGCYCTADVDIKKIKELLK